MKNRVCEYGTLAMLQRIFDKLDEEERTWLDATLKEKEAPPSGDFVTIAQIVEKYGITRQAVMKAIRHDWIAAIRRDGKWYIPTDLAEERWGNK